MFITQDNLGGLSIQREEREFKVYKDSTLMYKIAKELQKRYGLDVIRKDAGKDGNLTSEGNYYIRDRKRRFAWHFGNYQLRDAYQDFNASGIQSGDLFLDPLGEVPDIVKAQSALRRRIYASGPTVVESLA